MRSWLVAAALASAVLSVHTRAARAESNLPTPDHVVLVMMENHAFAQIVNPQRAPFIANLATGGALFLNAFAVAHPSEPNYFALFSGSTHGVRDDGYHSFDAPTLAGALAAAHRSFVGYVDANSPRKHNPWESFADARGVERNMSDFPSDFSALPTVSFVIPDLDHDMHDGSVRAGDRWLRAHLGAYAEWTKTHKSLLVITFDEDDDRGDNRIPTIIYGDDVRPGRYAQHITHYSVLSTLLAMYALPPFGHAATTPPIREIWLPAVSAAVATKPIRGEKL
ncbi:MAG: acid phosphatase [Alphaproteobacteria bacterium]|nr:acid phosphatase [Alphaproteobacteria bacterium]